MNKNLYFLETKDCNFVCETESRDQAFATFFRKILMGEVPLSDIGNVVLLHHEGETYPMRTVPLLYELGVINKETAIATLQKVLTTPRDEALTMLEEYAKEDSWILPLIKEEEER